MEKRNKILVIDDELHIRETLSDILEFSGYDVTCAENGKEGVKKAIEEVPDLILCDIMMPEINGFQVAKQIREVDELAITPFIFLSATTTMEGVHEGMILGADDYLTKPFNNQELIETIGMRLDHIRMFTGGAVEDQETMNYLKTLHSMTLPSDSKLQELFGKHFLIQTTENEISGDFYWLHEGDGRHYLVFTSGCNVGVQSTLMNMICYERLTRLLLHDPEIAPHLILQRLNTLLASFLNKLTEQHAGNKLRIAVCMMDEVANQLTYAGAGSHLLWYQHDQGIMQRIEGSELALGEGDNDHFFEQEIIPLSAQDRIYYHASGSKKIDDKLSVLIRSSTKSSLPEQRKVLEEALGKLTAAHGEKDTLILGFEF